jgi:cyclopropane-fatty-acyl-phospholipid synthase
MMHEVHANAHSAVARQSGRSGDTASRLRAFLEEALADFPWEIIFTDWTGQTYSIGQGQAHWRGCPLEIELKTELPGRDLLALNPLGYLERFVAGEVDMRGNIYLLACIRDHLHLSLSWGRLVRQMLVNRTFLFQSKGRASVNVKSHYDIPQEALNQYLDRTYLSYSCGMFEDPDTLDVGQLREAGQGRGDDFDSLEKAQWRKFKDAVDFVVPENGETLLDVGCGYGGQLQVALENHPFGKVVGWTHSHNQATEGSKMLASFEPARWELNEGDYRQDDRVFDHVTSTGMISHVGPRGLIPYVRNVRRRIRTGGRYVHHSLMTPYSPRPLDSAVGVAFNKKYVWPGFHWFTLGEHMKALEENGFEVTKIVNLSPHYGKTTAAWYERMMASAGIMRRNLGEPTFRAWQIYLATTSEGFRQKALHVYRIYCQAV